LTREVQKITDVRSAYAGILVEIKGAMGLLSDCKVSHIRREANEIAHALEQRAKRQQEYVVMRLSSPEFIRDLVMREEASSVNPTHTCNRSVP
jgi:dihydroxyacetone kinase-like predicted kinase